MKVPEKIWINPLLDLPKLNGVIDKDSIQYVRKNGFIDKACEWMENHNDYLRVHDNGRGVRFDMTQCVSDFRKAMEGE